ncbi:hypothetical protein RR48_07515 [Papilio machaon]|uniref:Uncharacterized protein n=1 Tax=Papilio machaon TaxID=76193 RepID=A0A194RRV0_PAPMA|nr:hypothetical protein RR48_07515 [Papilio machaon]
MVGRWLRANICARSDAALRGTFTKTNSLMVRRSFLQKEERRSRARLSWPFLSASRRRRSEGSDRAPTSPTGRSVIAAGPSETPRLSRHTGPTGHSSLAEDRTRARHDVDCRPPTATSPPRPGPTTATHTP